MARRGLENLGQYEEVLMHFRTADKDRNGFLSEDELHELLVMTNKRSQWTQSDTTRLFSGVDRDRNHVIDIKEFLNYVFDRRDAMGGTHAGSDYDRVLETFRRCDSNFNGTLDQREFKQLMDILQPGKWDQTMIAKVWKKVDKDGSGEVSCEELLAYIFRGDSSIDKRQRKQHAEQIAAEAQQGKISGMMQQHTRDDAVIVEFECGPRLEKTVDGITAIWMRNPLLRANVKVLKKLMPQSNCISKVSARQGAVIFWDRRTMMAHRDDPFENPNSQNKWTGEMQDRDLPNLIESKAIVKEESKEARKYYNRNKLPKKPV